MRTAVFTTLATAMLASLALAPAPAAAKTIKDCQKELPKGTTGTEMLPEAMFWLLLTGQVPSTNQVRQISRELAEQAELPAFVDKMLDDFPKDLHPITQFAIAVSALSHT